MVIKGQRVDIRWKMLGRRSTICLQYGTNVIGRKGTYNVSRNSENPAPGCYTDKTGNNRREFENL